MRIEIKENFTIPSSTAQQRKIGGNRTHPTQGLRYARAAWQALFEAYSPAFPVPKGAAVILFVDLYYHTSNPKLDGKFKTTRPDGDNLIKVIKDAMTKCGFWEDDSQVQERIFRYWTSGEEHVEITVMGEKEYAGSIDRH